MRAILIVAFPVLLGWWSAASALNAALDVNQYAHAAWTVRDGFSLGNIYSMAQTPDGYLWLGSEFGLYRFDGVRTVRWLPPPRQHLPETAINRLLVAHDGTLWIGTFGGLVMWSGSKLSRVRELEGKLITALFEDREGTVWVGTMGRRGELCAIRGGGVRCYGPDLNFGTGVWTLYEDGSGTLWAGAQSGLWRIGPGRPKRYPTVPAGGAVLQDSGPIGLTSTGDGRLLIAMHYAGLMQLDGHELKPLPIAIKRVDANKLLRDRDGGLWIATVDQGLIHLHAGRLDTFNQPDGLSGDIILSLFEDREGSMWISTTGGLDHFRELPVSTMSVEQGLAGDATGAVLAGTDGSVWISSHNGLTRWTDGRITIFRRASGLPDDSVQSLFEDSRHRIWAFTDRGLAYFEGGRFIALPAIAGGDVHYIAGDSEGNLWLSERQSLLHLRHGSLIERIPWSDFGHHQNASVLVSDDQGGLWLGFWRGGGVSYFKDGQVRASYSAADGLGEGVVAGLRLDHDGTLWVATHGGISRIKDGHINTLTSENGLPCNNAFWTVDDEQGSLWTYMACGLVRISRSELDAWISNSKEKVQTTVFGPQDGVRLRDTAASGSGPRVASSAGGIWFLSGGGVQVFDPRHLVFNRLPPPVHIEQVIADGRLYWQNLLPAAPAALRLPPRTRDLEIDYTALSLVAPQEDLFRYKLEGRDRHWHDVGDRRRAYYTDLPPGSFRFSVMAGNNSGVWNEQGVSLNFSIAPAFWQTLWFRVICGAALVAMLLLLYQLRVRQLALEFNRMLDARVHERVRIARELHDTLLQSFQGVLLQFGAALRLLSREPDKARQVLVDAIEQAEDAIEEGREAVQGLRVSAEEATDLATPLMRLGKELIDERGGEDPPSVRVQVRGEARPLHPIERDEIFRIAAEALRNAVHHAQPTQIAVELRYGAGEFVLCVRDDGRGVDPKVLAEGTRAGHFGLRGMRERAVLAGGKVTLWSALGAGTEVELVIPASKAYVIARRDSFEPEPTE